MKPLNKNKFKINKEEDYIYNIVPHKAVSLIKEWENIINYKYNDKGELVNKKTLKKSKKLDPQEYELVGTYVQHYVEDYLIRKYNLEKLYVPNNNISPDFSKRDKEQAQCKILITKDFYTNPKCLILIQGSGSVKLGQWSRSVCINENLSLGTMGPYIEKAKKNNLSVIILNPNERFDFFDDNKIIKEFYTMENHCLYVYKNIIKRNQNIKEIYIVAHSKGGECAIELLIINKEDLLNKKIKKIAFTDSSHGYEYFKLGDDGLQIFRRISRDYITSTKTVGTFLKSYYDTDKGVNLFSSGHNRHEYTSGYAINEIFKFFFEENKSKIINSVKSK